MVHKQPGDLPAVGRERIDTQKIIMRSSRDPDAVAGLLRLRVIQPIDDLPYFIGDLVRRRILVEIQAVLGDVLPVFDGLDVSLLRMENEIDLLDDIERDREALLRREIAHELDSLFMSPDIVDGR